MKTVGTGGLMVQCPTVHSIGMAGSIIQGSVSSNG